MTESTQPAVIGAVPAARVTATRRAADRAGERRSGLIPYGFLAVPLALYAVWVIGPMLSSIYMSMTNSDGLTQQDWVGFANYRRLWHDPVFKISILNNVKWLLIFITVPTLCGLGLALLLNNTLPGVRFIKAGIFSPMVLSSVVIAVVWSWMYFPADGLINSTLAKLGARTDIGWLSNPKLVTYSIIGAAVWRQIGYVMLLYLAGLKNVDATLVDASKVDGADSWHSFKDIVLPQLQPVTVIVVVISIIDALRSFDLVNLMTDGGPFYKSNVLSQMMYKEAFNNYNMGYGAAIAVVLMLISMVFIFTYLRRMVKEELEY